MSIFMKIDKLDKVDGGATVTEIDKKKGLFKLDSISWGAVRGTSVEVGNANNADKGIVVLGELNISRTCDGATPYLITLLYSPGNEGKGVNIFVTKPSRDGKGVSQNITYNLSGCRISNYQTQSHAGGEPSESFSLTYTKIENVFHTEDEKGTVSKNATVTYDVPKAEMVSGASL
ncbi:type VI secretion system tube protein Hcp [Thalassomonas sp. RHCl1]|uniref:type VI secretion system tube protein Hcp n=1 Tax=Thalassomonas sp. RHCl1 TaxID=2995320 RepID=UPI00248D0AA7|nr:type VI secretion system tube protein Hcp [Thalassomonas sp. RHCl1]